MHSPDPASNKHSITITFQAQKHTALKWRESSSKERTEKLKKWIMDNRKLIQEAIYQDFKKPKTETDSSEVFPVISEINHTLKNIERWMQVMQEEIFGPILPILEHSDLESAIDYINGKPKPLASYYFGNLSDEVSTILPKQFRS